MLKTLIDDIKLNFDEAVTGFEKHNLNEIHFDVRNDMIVEVCDYLHNKQGMALVSMFANDEREIEAKKFCIYYVFEDRKNSVFVMIRTALDEYDARLSSESFFSIGEKVFASSSYEREIKDMFGLEPVGNPEAKPIVFHGNWPKGNFPLRKDFDGKHKPAFVNGNQKFTKVKGEGVFEIPVGPVHAGIIEPGHFRFSVAGENIVNLEAQLSFVHKGIEKLCEGMDFRRAFYVSERISGDETFANSLCFCQAIEKIAGVKVPQRAMFIRVLFAELERVTSHLGDLAGICLDVAYGFAAFQFRLMRGWAYLLADELCGMRFLRSVNAPGGVRQDFVAGKEKSVLDYILRIKNELLQTIAIIKSNGLFLDRIENTGILRHKVAVDLNAVGPPARAAGIWHDMRKTFPYEAYGSLMFAVPEHRLGDVNCRMNVKLEEALESLELMRQCVESMWEGAVAVEIKELPPYMSALGYCEAPRGENIHWLMTGENNTIFRYKIRTASFCNWPVLCHAVVGNIVPDFPLINKSFNLSYAGNDL